MPKICISLSNKNSVYKSRLREKFQKNGIPEEGIDLAFIIAEYKLKGRVMSEFSPSRWNSSFNTSYRIMIRDLTTNYLQLLQEE